MSFSTSHNLWAISAKCVVLPKIKNQGVKEQKSAFTNSTYDHATNRVWRFIPKAARIFSSKKQQQSNSII
jgi:hypothetical protein